MGSRQNRRTPVAPPEEILWAPPWATLAALAAWGIYCGRAYFTRPEHSPAFVQVLEPIINAPYFDLFKTPPSLLFSHAAHWGWIAAFLFCAFHVGDKILKKLSCYDRLGIGEAAMAAGLGLFVFSMIIFILLTLRALYAPVLWALLAASLALALFRQKKVYTRFLPSKDMFFSWTRLGLSEKSALAVLALFCGTLFMASLVPEVFYDSLVYHLALPYLWFVDHAFTPLPFLAFSTMPTLTQLNYVWGYAGSELFLYGDTLGRMLHLSMGFLTSAAVYGYVQPKWGRLSGLLAGIFFYAVPVVTMNSWTSGNDVGAGLYQTLGILALLKWQEDPQRPQSMWILSALFVGAALSSKYTAIFSAASTFLIAAYLNFRRNLDFKSRMIPILVYGAVLALVWAPWIIKNIITTGNPLHPFLFGIFGGQNISDILKWKDTGKNFFLGAEFNIFHILKLDFIWMFLSSFWRVAMTGADSVKYMGPMLLLLGPCIFFLKKWPAPIKTTFWIFILSYFFWFLGNDFARYLAPAYPCMALTLAFAWTQIQNQFGKELRAALLAVPLGIAVAVWGPLANMVHHIHAPWDVLTGKLSRKDYLSYSRPTYPNPSYKVYQYANQNLPKEGVRVLLIGDNKAFGLKRSFFYYTVEYNNPILQTWIKESADSEELYKKMKAERLTHIILNCREFIRLHPYLWKTRDKEILHQFWTKHLRTLPYNAEGTFIYEIVPALPQGELPAVDLISEIDQRGWKPQALLQSLIDLGLWDSAIDEAESWLRLGNPVYALLAKLHLQRNKAGDPQKAISVLELGLRQQPNNLELQQFHQALTQPRQK